MRMGIIETAVKISLQKMNILKHREDDDVMLMWVNMAVINVNKKVNHYKLTPIQCHNC